MPRFQRVRLGGAFLLIVLISGCEFDKAPPSSPGNSSMEFSSPDLEGAPKIPPMSVLRPFVETTLGTIEAGQGVGTAFAIEVEENKPPLVLTSLRLLGPLAGLNRQAKASELRSIHRGITFGDAFGGTDGVFEGVGFVEIEESAPYPEDSLAGDILVIRMPSKSRVGRLKLGSTLPNVGDKVWMSTALYAGAPPSQRQHAAVVVEVNDRGHLCYQFQGPTLSFEGTMGAPILSVTGEVVAIHLEGKERDGKQIGIGNPAARFIPFLSLPEH